MMIMTSGIHANLIECGGDDSGVMIDDDGVVVVDDDDVM